MYRVATDTFMVPSSYYSILIFKNFVKYVHLKKKNQYNERYVDFVVLDKAAYSEQTMW